MSPSFEPGLLGTVDLGMIDGASIATIAGADATPTGLWTDPAEWCAEQGSTLWTAQEEILRLVYSGSKRICVVAGNEVGKGHVVSWLCFHWLQQPDSRVITSANTNQQVLENTWYEIRKSHRKYGWPGEVQTQKWKFSAAKEAIGVTTNEDDAFQGKHEGRLLVVFDESSGKRLDLLWSDLKTLVGEDGVIVLVGNPKRRTGIFAKAIEGDFGFEVLRVSGVEAADWQRENFTLPGLVSWSILRQWAEDDSNFPRDDTLTIDDLRAWYVSTTWTHPKTGVEIAGGLRDDWARVHVLGLKPKGEESILFPPDLVDMSQAARPDPTGDIVFGLDVARSGGDRTVLTERRGFWTREILNLAKTTHDQTLALVVALYEERMAKHQRRPNIDPKVRTIRVDATGEGSGLADFLSARNIPIERIHFGGKPKDAEKYGNVRGELYHTLRSWMASGGQIPEGDEITEELEGMEPQERAGKDGNMVKIIARKSELREIIGRSPDRADALVLTMIPGRKPGASGLKIHKTATARRLGV